MKRINLRCLLFLALCCDLGLFAKRLVSPMTNIITDALHIPGGISTSFSLMFLVVAATLTGGFGCATIMAFVQSVLALSFGMVGSMGPLSPVGYIVPGVMIDLSLLICKNLSLAPANAMTVACTLASVSAAFTANLIVFGLQGVVLLLYISVSASSGAVCGQLGAVLEKRLELVIGAELRSSRQGPGRRVRT